MAPECQWHILGEGRICDRPAVATYHGIGGSSLVCREHADGLLRGWGIKCPPLEHSSGEADR